MTSLRVRNWDKWQSYRKDRGTPPWIKVHRVLFTNPDWAVLTDAEKGQLISIWIAAADNGGNIPYDPRVLRKICMLDDEPDINKFIHLGFIEADGCHVDATLTPLGCRVDPPETETETETEDKKTTAPEEKPDAENKEKDAFYQTKKKRRLSGESLERFLEFWKEFGYAKGKAEAADSWIDVYRKCDFEAIIYGAKREEENRSDIIAKNQTPKMAQGWLSGRRWEDEDLSGAEPENTWVKNELFSSPDVPH